jgi:hypothetical protein
MTLVFIENMFGSGQIVTISESFNGCVLEHGLKPGENRRLALSRFKSVVVNEQHDASIVSLERLAELSDLTDAPQ